MATSKNQLFFFFLLHLLLTITALGDDSLAHRCENSITNNDLLKRNIDDNLLALLNQSSLQGYSISTFGEGYETVYGVTRCDGDLSTKFCALCISNAVQEIRSLCPNASSARIWYEICYLRYDTTKFFGVADISYGREWYSGNPAGDPKAVWRVMDGLMARVMAAAASSEEKFGWGGIVASESLTVYGMGQCTRDLGAEACGLCLRSSLQELKSYCLEHVGCRILGSSCVLRYEIYKFLFLNPSSDGDIAPAIAPAISPAGELD